MAARNPVLAWLDLEMTGLDPATCHIVQLALILTNSELEELAPPLELTIWQPTAVLDTMCPYVRAMHVKSGLLPQITRSEISIEEAEQEVMALLTKHAPYRTARLCGNSIYQDRKFLHRYMPGFESYLHYRQIDVSTIKELALWWYGTKYSKRDGGQHTALFDIRQSIDEMKYYRKQIMRHVTEA